MKLENGLLSGTLNFEQDIEGSTVKIHELMSFHKDGCYFNWSISNVGFGEFSMSYQDGKWQILNECMSLARCALLMATLERGLQETTDMPLSEVKSVIEGMSNNLSASSLSMGLHMIWNEANKEG